jgi:hypothetical protein
MKITPRFCSCRKLQRVIVDQTDVEVPDATTARISRRAGQVLGICNAHRSISAHSSHRTRGAQSPTTCRLPELIGKGVGADDGAVERRGEHDLREL